MKLQLPAGEFRAYLFDCDGTIVDSMPLHYVAWKKALAKWGCSFDEKLFYSWGGRPTVDIVASLNELNGLQMPPEEVAHEKELLYFELLPTLQVIPEVVEIINARQGQIPFAVVSGGKRESVVRSLKIVHLEDCFETMVTADDYKNGKPAPDCFLMAAERLGISPADCLVFEDTETGIQAATAAGMKTVKVPLPFER
jgi:beta-phosphoglucomutase family hydrolase